MALPYEEHAVWKVTCIICSIALANNWLLNCFLDALITFMLGRPPKKKTSGKNFIGTKYSILGEIKFSNKLKGELCLHTPFLIQELETI